MDRDGFDGAPVNAIIQTVVDATNRPGEGVRVLVANHAGYLVNCDLVESAARELPSAFFEARVSGKKGIAADSATRGRCKDSMEAGVDG